MNKEVTTSSPAADQAELLAYHQNEGLFSNHYLDKRLPDRRVWKETDPKEALERLERKYREEYPSLEDLSERQLQTTWINAVLDVLGWSYQEEVNLKTRRKTRRPDYALFANEEDRRDFPTDKVATESDFSEALAVADAKHWHRDLDHRGTDSSSLSDVPSGQIDRYMRFSGLDWGILTNGRYWRLFHIDTSKRPDTYYEVDLQALLEQKDRDGALEAFKYFFLFFRREAFLGDGRFVDSVLQQSRAYQNAVSEDLEDQVFDAVRALAQGFFDYPDNDLEHDAETLQRVYDNSLIVLYRILFVLFAESRGLLPVGERGYRLQYSLFKLKQDLADNLDQNVPSSSSTAGIWKDLRELWRIIDKGNEDFGVPAYNGGLFRPERYPLLEENVVGDEHLRSAIDLLARSTDADDDSDDRVFVDYRDLDVRHLGSIYEGLLEHDLRIADEPLDAVPDDDVVEFHPADDPSDADHDEGEVYLVTDDGERKETGSYYTPDYVVEYIVEHSVEPLLDELHDEYSNDDGEITDPNGLVEATLNVDVLDPAMGSGHFLVGALDHIARFLVDVAAGADFEEQEQRDADTELDYWRRRVAQACLYGVDINPLAVELSKLSLWLRTVARNKPLSFLDHHLRCGNSLIGADVEELPLEREQSEHHRRKERRAREAGQVSMLEDSAFAASVKTATRWMEDIEEIRGESLAEVERAEEIYRDTVRSSTSKPRLIADIHAARDFGLDISDGLFGEMSDRILHGGYEGVPQFEEVEEEAREIAEDYGFFHWQLEYPEVFFDDHGRMADDAGFDAVIGNPPYVRMEQFKWFKDYLEEHYETYDTRTDLYVYFAERSVELCRPGGRYGVIVANKWLRTNYGRGLRELLLKETALEEMIDFGDLPVFGVTTYPLILVASPGAEPGEVLTAAPETLEELDLERFVRENHRTFEQSSLDEDEWPLEGVEAKKVLKEKIESNSIPFGEYIGMEPLRGIVTGLNNAFVISESKRRELIDADPNCEELLLPLCGGDEVRRYHLNWSRSFLIYTHHGIEIDNYPAIRDHLEQYRSQLRTRAGDQEWYELQQPQEAYEEYFRNSKIINPDLAAEARFALDERGFVTTNTAYFVPESSFFLLGVLNSAITTTALRLSASKYRGGYIRLQSQFLEQIPVPSESNRRGRVSVDVEDRADKLASFEDSGAGDKQTFEAVIGTAAEEITSLHERRQKNERALDPFKYFDSGVDFEKFRDVLDEWLTHAELVEDIGQYRHDVDDLEMRRNHLDEWELRVELKKRDPNDWSNYQKVEDGREIGREWVTAFRFPDLPDEIGAYYRLAFDAPRDQFAQSKSYAGGKTRSTHKKLNLSVVPVYDESVPTEEIADLERKLEETKSRITELEQLVDDAVYEMYDLSEEDVETIEEFVDLEG
jgi:type I restriction-modification system DNA methylase subunit